MRVNKVHIAVASLLLLLFLIHVTWRFGGIPNTTASEDKSVKDYRFPQVPLMLNVIPKLIVQTARYSQNKIPPKMREAMDSFKTLNPGFEYYYLDDNAVNIFFLKYYGSESEEYWAFCNLVPGAFKADLFRYCFLYIFGGFYTDSDMVALTSFENVVDFKRDKFVTSLEKVEFGLFQAIMASTPKHPILRVAIDAVIHNVKIKAKPAWELEITGPVRAFDCFL